jgi:hypothetical protein
MDNSPTEADWKYLRSIMPELVETFSRKHCDRLREILADTTLSENDKRHDCYQFARENFKAAYHCFDSVSLSRSNLFIYCVGLTGNGILTKEYIVNFSEPFRDYLLSLPCLSPETVPEEENNND